MLVGCSSNLCALSIAVSPSSLLKWPLVRSWQSGGDGKGGSEREHTGESWIMWKINTFEALELAGRRSVVSVVKCPAFIFSPSHSMWLYVQRLLGDVDAVDPQPWGFIKHTCNWTYTPTSSTQWWAFAAPLWPKQHPSYVFCRRHAGDTALAGYSLFFNGVLLCLHYFSQGCSIDKADKAGHSSSQPVSSSSCFIGGDVFIARGTTSIFLWLIQLDLKTIS